jgi:uncharacterized membrane protein (UPF0127 family)
MKQVVVSNKTKSVVVGTQIGLANTSWTRLIGLAGKSRLGAGCGLLIRPSSGVHTFGMRFSIDVVALDRKLKVVKLWHRLAPFRVTSVSFETRNVLELPAGTIREAGIDVGDQLEII